LDEPDQAEVPSFHLFKRLMAERRYKGKLFGDISAVTQVNRDISIVEEMVINQDWHSRLIYGSDYPLTGVMPVYSLSDYLDKKYISVEQGDLLTKIRKHNPLMFDFLFKRMIRIDGREFLPSIFESRRNFDKTASVQAV
ncbi:MAG: hypothetical protein OEX00_01090, partial [Gammaproteobacteria bacterium]|nr:hypothetical protein [Gammaproteobacteria bacterium]